MTQGENPTRSFGDYGVVVLRWLRPIGVFVALCAVVGGSLAVLDRGSYRAEAVVQVQPMAGLGGDPALDPGLSINGETEEAVARSQRVAERALAIRTAVADLEATDLASDEVLTVASDLAVDPDAARLASERLAVAVLPESQILVITATGDEPGELRSLAQSTAVAYLEHRHWELTVALDESRRRLAAREAELVAELDALSAAAPAETDAVPADAVLAPAEVAKRQELTVIGATFAGLATRPVDPGTILTDAAAPIATEGFPVVSGLLIGALLGFVGALGAVLVIDRTDDRLRTTSSDGRVLDGRSLGAPLLGSAPVTVRQAVVAGGSPTDRGPLVHPVNTAESDAYRRLQGTLLFNLDRHDRTVVLVAGVRDAVAATAVAANIGATAARAGRRTLLVAADLRNDRLGDQLGVTPGSGLSDVILGEARLSESIQPVDGVDNLGVLQAGTRLDRPSDVVQSNALGRLMAAVRADYDLVVVEVPPVLDVADAVDVAGLCDAAVLVAEAGSESKQAIARSVEQLRSVGSDIVGVVAAD